MAVLTHIAKAGSPMSIPGSWARENMCSNAGVIACRQEVTKRGVEKITVMQKSIKNGNKYLMKQNHDNYM